MLLKHTLTPGDNSPTECAAEDYEIFFSKCCSDAERLLLQALIDEAGLLPRGEYLQGRIQLIPQAKISKHYIDFLINDKLAVEITEFNYKIDRINTIHDRIRNELISLAGYQWLKLTADDVLADPHAAARKLIATAHETESF